jgi:purine-cytosine permease-like protein
MGQVHPIYLLYMIGICHDRCHFSYVFGIPYDLIFSRWNPQYENVYSLPMCCGIGWPSILDLIPKSVFRSVIAVVFQSVFHSKMYQNNVFFLFFLNHFWHQCIKMIKNTKKI